MDTPSFDDPQYQTDFTDLQWSQNVGVTRLPLADPPAFFRGVEAGWVAGTVLWLDFPFPALSGNMAHWAELLLPVYSALRSGAWKAAVPEGGDAHYVRAVLFPSLGRDSLQVGVCGSELQLPTCRVWVRRFVLQVRPPHLPLPPPPRRRCPG